MTAPAPKIDTWSQAERRAWKWPDALTVSAWSHANRIITGHDNAEPGPWRNERTPYLIGIMDAIFEPGIEEIVVIKAAQIGFSESIRNVLGFWIDHEPGPCLVVMPDQKSAEELIEERIKPLLISTPAVARHVTGRAWDVKKQSIKLDTMSIYLGWAGSSQAMKSRAIRYLLLEEPDEYPRTTGAGGDPISKAMKRITTYAAKGRARVIIGGTPTTRTGNISRRWEVCTQKRHYWVPCPHCGKFQTLIWDRVKWPDIKARESDRDRRAAAIEAENLAYYQCEHCKGEIRDHHKPAMLSRGVWANEDQVVTAAGKVAGPTPAKSKRVGFKISAIYSPWVSLSKLAAEFVAAKGDSHELCDFINERLAEPFEEQRAKTSPELIQIKASGAPEPDIVPDWCRALIATADTQGVDEQTGYFWYVIRAWGFEYRSQLIDYGIAHSKEELKQRTLDRQFQTESGQLVSPIQLVVDSGGPRWNEVYQFSLTDNRIRPAKGSNGARTWPVTERPQKRHRVILWEIDTEQAKDLLHRLIHSPDQTLWLPHNQVQADYCRQMCSEAKTFNSRLGREEWVEIITDMNHLWDCEATQCAAAWRAGLAGVDKSRTNQKWFANQKKR